LAAAWLRASPSTEDLAPQPYGGYTWPAALVREFERVKGQIGSELKTSEDATYIVMAIFAAAGVIRVIWGGCGGTK
jgi:hypothetical protein